MSDPAGEVAGAFADAMELPEPQRLSALQERVEAIVAEQEEG